MRLHGFMWAQQILRELIQNQTAMLHLIILKMFGLIGSFKGMFGLMRLVLEQFHLHLIKMLNFTIMRQGTSDNGSAMSCHIETSEVEIDETGSRLFMIDKIVPDTSMTSDTNLFVELKSRKYPLK